MKRDICSLLFVALVFAFLYPNQTKATAILHLSFDQVCQGSELIFDGRVVSKETKPSLACGKPFTYFTFQIIEVIKGSYQGSTIELGYLGGQLGEITLKVSGMHMPVVGERGIYFVENFDVQQIHPLCGWHQGHCLVVSEKQTGQELVIPVEDKNLLKTNAFTVINAPTLEVFKQNIRNVFTEEK